MSKLSPRFFPRYSQIRVITGRVMARFQCTTYRDASWCVVLNGHECLFVNRIVVYRQRYVVDNVDAEISGIRLLQIVRSYTLYLLPMLHPSLFDSYWMILLTSYVFSLNVN